MTASSYAKSKLLRSLKGVCHHCGRLLHAQEGERLTGDKHLAGRTAALHCTTCLEHYHPPERASFPWRRVFGWVIKLLKLLLALVLLTLIGGALAAMIQRNDFGLGALWQQVWPTLAPWWEPVGPAVNPYLRQLQPLLDMIKELLGGFL